LPLLYAEMPTMPSPDTFYYLLYGMHRNMIQLFLQWQVNGAKCCAYQVGDGNLCL
jgi:hypothetical protein